MGIKPASGLFRSAAVALKPAGESGKVQLAAGRHMQGFNKLAVA